MAPLMPILLTQLLATEGTRKEKKRQPTIKKTAQSLIRIVDGIRRRQSTKFK